EQELAGCGLAVALPDVGDATAERAAERRSFCVELTIERVAIALIVQISLDQRDERDADDERRDELAGQPHSSVFYRIGALRRTRGADAARIPVTKLRA